MVGSKSGKDFQLYVGSSMKKFGCCSMVWACCWEVTDAKWNKNLIGYIFLILLALYYV